MIILEVVPSPLPCKGANILGSFFSKTLFIIEGLTQVSLPLRVIFCAISLFRCQCRYLSVDISAIQYAGYLLKRSNRPYAPHIAPPFPVAGPFHDENSVVAVTTESSPQLPSSRREFTDAFHGTATDDVDAPDALPHGPLHEHIEQRERLLEKEEEEVTSPLERGLEFAASFFGIPYRSRRPPPPAAAAEISTIDESAVVVNRPLSTPITAARSSPIKMTPPKAGGNSLSAFRDSPQNTAVFGGDPNAVMASTNHRSVSDCSQPADFVDPKDGHIWRAKYCVLEGETLFFYRHESVANSPEALQERQLWQFNQQQQQRQQEEETQTTLADSPVMPEFTVSSEDNHYLWEKRVALECVGAVRSAEMEHGPNSFELSAVDDEGRGGDGDKLVLRARNQEEMNEWLFQFHRAIATFVMDIMDHVAPVAALGDLHHPKFTATVVPGSAGSVETPNSEASPIRSATLATAFSPRFQKMIRMSPTTTPSLSHGHGRSSMHRRRRVDDVATTPTGARSLPSQASYSPDGSTSSASFPFPMLGQDALLPDQQLRPSRFLVTPDEEEEPEICASASDYYPETERPPPASGKYVPPHIRARQQAEGEAGAKYVPPHLRQKKYVPPHLRNNVVNAPQQERYIPRHARQTEQEPIFSIATGVSLTVIDASRTQQKVPSFQDHPEQGGHEQHRRIKLGGCADPVLVKGSILDDVYIPRKASRLGKVRTVPFGCVSSTSVGGRTLQWEIGAASECGIRESNEDSYLVASDLLKAFGGHVEQPSVTFWDQCRDVHPPGLFAVFDGHCGDQASRFAAERLTHFIYNESLSESEKMSGNDTFHADHVKTILQRAIHKLDTEFCNLCVEEGRAWESGSTALIAALVNKHLVIANLGDARAIVGRSVADTKDAACHEAQGWNELPLDDYAGDRRCLWKEVTETHNPSREDERARIHKANGWVTTEQEIPIGQFKRMALDDDDVVDILKRCFADRYQPSPKASAPHRFLRISRVCGELAVSVISRLASTRQVAQTAPMVTLRRWRRPKTRCGILHSACLIQMVIADRSLEIFSVTSLSFRHSVWERRVSRMNFCC
jgi:hypothetical protein